MTMPTDVGIIDLMLGIPEGSKKDWYGFLKPACMDEESKDDEFPAQYMFKDVPQDIDAEADPVAVVLGEMDHFGIERRWSASSFEREHLDRGRVERAPRPLLRLLRASTPTGAWQGVRDLVKAYETLGIKAATAFPAGMTPAGADQRQEVLPDLRQVHRARHPDLRHHRRPGPRVPMPARRPSSSTRCAGSSPSSSS